MFKFNQCGRSMVEMLGVLGIISVLTVGALAGYGKAMYKYNLNKTFNVVAGSLKDLATFTNRGFGGYSASKSKMAEKAKAAGLLPDCKPIQSAIAGSGYQVCEAPLGEIYPKFVLTDKEDIGSLYSYMLYVTFLKNKTNACKDFLSKRWDTTIPEKYKRSGKVWIISNKGERTVYSGGSHSFSLAGASSACKSICGSSASYCSVVFDFSGYAY